MRAVTRTLIKFGKMTIFAAAVFEQNASIEIYECRESSIASSGKVK